MDEIDAALDFKNVSIVACYIYVSMGPTNWVDKLHDESWSYGFRICNMFWKSLFIGKHQPILLSLSKALNPGIDDTMIQLNFISQLILKGQVTPKSKILIFSLTCSVVFVI